MAGAVESGFEQEPAGDEPAVEFELDLDADAGAGSEIAEGASTRDGDLRPSARPSAPSTSFPAPGAPPSVPENQVLLDRLARLERQNLELMDTARAAGWNRQPQQQPPARRTLEQIKGDPNATIEDLVDAIRGEQDEIRSQAYGASELAARRTNSEQRARGLFSSAAVGEGYDFDSMRGRYLDNVYRQSPRVRELLHEAVPGDPALGEYVFATILEFVEKAGDDPVKAINLMRAGLAAPAEGARQVTEKISEAARRQADKVARGSAASSAGGRRKLSAADIEGMSDAEFDKLVAQQTRRGATLQ